MHVSDWLIDGLFIPVQLQAQEFLPWQVREIQFLS
jgi:hypothetical protein